VTVDEYHRVRVSSEISNFVPWIDVSTKQIECVGAPGPSGGIQLVPRSEHLKQTEPLVQALGDTLPSGPEAAQDWVEVARLLATAWPITLNVEASRVSITLPEAARRAKLVPQYGGIAVIFGFGGILEIWDALDWNAHVRLTAKRKVGAIADALEDIGNR